MTPIQDKPAVIKKILKNKNKKKADENFWKRSSRLLKHHYKENKLRDKRADEAGFNANLLKVF